MTRGLKEIYVNGREIAKRNDLLFWAVSQASNDAHDRQFIDYSMMDNSKTGKAGEADIIIGIGKTGSSEVENTVRHICISKNKINGYHGMINAQIDIATGGVLLMRVLTFDVETTHRDKPAGGTTALPHFGNRLVSVGYKWLGHPVSIPVLSPCRP